MTAVSPGSQSENGGCFSQTTGKKDGFTNQTPFYLGLQKGSLPGKRRFLLPGQSPCLSDTSDYNYIERGKALFRRLFIPVQGLGCLPPFQCPYGIIRRRPPVRGQALDGLFYQ